jgi:putative ATPase
VGIERAWEAAEARGSLPVPKHLRNAPTALMKQMGYGAAYQYPHDAPDRFVATGNLPEPLADATFYQPKRVGAEADIAERLAAWRRRRAAADESEG